MSSSGWAYFLVAVVCAGVAWFLFVDAGKSFYNAWMNRKR